jgi:hypothetical protein
MSHKRQVETDRETRERTDHVSLWPARGSCDPSLLARGAERVSFLSTGTVVGSEGHFTPPLHKLLHRSLHPGEKSKYLSNHSDRSFAKGGIARGRDTL